MKIIETNDALKPKGHYSQAIEHDGIIYVSGILPFDHKTGYPVVGDVKMQAKENLLDV